VITQEGAVLTDTVPDILARIVARKQWERSQSSTHLADLERRAGTMTLSRRDFRAALLARSPAIIAEIKKASPSKGLISADFDPARLARQYESGGAAALSVLTDEHFFQGSLANLRSAREAVALPVLRKDFTLDEYHVVEAAAHGADAILLIVAILDAKRIRALRAAAAAYGMAALVEAHDATELAIALDAGADLIGVNNRDLKTFEVKLDTSLRLAARIPREVVKVAESGIHSAADVSLLLDVGFQAFLVGEHLMKSPSPASALKELTAAPRTMVKICGITNREDALAAIGGGAAAVGFNFYSASPRYLDPDQAAGIAAGLPGSVWKVGVFVNEAPERVAAIARQVGLDVAQLHGAENETDYPAGLRVWKAARVDAGFRLADIDACSAEAVLLDAPAGEAYGGTGRTFDWSRAAGSRKRIILAGGLDAGNVRQAIATARPWGVDICSRIESQPGRKDHVKMAQFLKEATA
jgi:indole-3-glycerol phosphate synthase/phosphoribosylanthranilate isomerase/anthranilate synthase/indole-3-glycerol phosphate synthase/phosphoribosylanthranilate isomerase